MTYTWKPTRRDFLMGAAAVAGAGAIGVQPFAGARAAGFPERNINVIIPTAEGGGADRNFRAFSGTWKKYLNTNFEPGYFPGAAGRVGYEVYMGKREADCHNLIFGNMGPELLNWVVKPPENFKVSDYVYFGQVDTDPGCVFVGNRSPFQSIDDIVAEGKKCKLTVGTSRMAHPASVGILALGEKVGIEFNLIPLSGGKKTIAGAVTGEVDFSVLTSGSVAAAHKSVRTLLVFDDKNKLGERLDNAPTLNDHFGMKTPPLLSARAFGIHQAAIDAYPDRFKILQDTFKQVFDDPEFITAFKKAKGEMAYLNPGGIAECEKYTKDIMEIGERYKSLLSGKA
ncbi:MAG: twin-arginine translocation signal domain-containing protein [Rhodospirillales bacterium]|nr:twin-arginine translocation signal domain-containing protein [Rhodospirillales bacterium]